MKIGINASFLRKRDSGIGQVSWNFLDKLIDFSKDGKYGAENLEFILYLEEDIDFSLPKNFKKKVFLPTYKRDDLIRKIWWEKFLLPQKAEEDRCNVFFSLYQSTTIFSENSKVRHLMLVHDAVVKLFPQYLNNFRKKIYYNLVDKAIIRADEVMTISKNSKKDIEELYSIDKERVIVNYIDCDSIFSKKVSKTGVEEVLKKYQLEKDNYIFYVGGFDVRKNVRRLIEAYASFLKDCRKIEKKGKSNSSTVVKNCPKLVLAGKFYQRLVPLVDDIPEIIKDLQEKEKLDKNMIKLIDFVPQKDLPALYVGARFFCFPSLYEGFGLPVLEAMKVSCPLITSNNSSIPELVNSKGAILVNPKTTKRIKEAMVKMNEDESLRKGLTKEGLRQSKRFNWEIFVKNFLNNI